MAHKLYFDNKSTYNLTADDKAATFDGSSGLFVLADDGSDYVTNESRVTDRSVASAVSNMAADDALLFDFGASTTMDFMAVHVEADVATNIQILRSAATTGDTTSVSLITDDLTAGWNVFDFTSVSSRYWSLRVSDAFAPTEIFFGTALNLPIDGAGITIDKPYNTFIASTYNNAEFSNKVDTELRTWSIDIPILTSDDKTELENLITNYKNLYKFIYYDETSYHNVRLSKPLTFNQIASNTYSTTLALHEQSTA